METKYKCEKCGSESVNTPGTCCGGGERKACDTCNVEQPEHKMDKVCNQRSRIEREKSLPFTILN